MILNNNEVFLIIKYSGIMIFLGGFNDFAIVFFVMFMVIRTVSEIKTPPPAAATSGASDNDLLSESRDLLKK